MHYEEEMRARIKERAERERMLIVYITPSRLFNLLSCLIFMPIKKNKGNILTSIYIFIFRW